MVAIATAGARAWCPTLFARAPCTDLLHYSGLNFGDWVSDAVDASDLVRNLLGVIGWLLMLPAAWLTTVYFEKPIGALITRACA
jgi:hypothetical protein